MWLWGVRDRPGRAPCPWPVRVIGEVGAASVHSGWADPGTVLCNEWRRLQQFVSMARREVVRARTASDVYTSQGQQGDSQRTLNGMLLPEPSWCPPRGASQGAGGP